MVPFLDLGAATAEIRVELDEALGRVLALIHYPIPPHLQAAYADLGCFVGAFPIAERIHRECLSLPIGRHLTGDRVGRVIDAVCSFEP